MFTHLYIHIPYCVRKCPYCAFNSRQHPEGVPDSYCAALADEMARHAACSAPPARIDTVYFGGGTPSLLEQRQVDQLLAAAARHFIISGNAEITLEANPGTVDAAALSGFRRSGINRLSLGCQSFNDADLRMLGRAHTAQDAREAFAAARSAGFDNISIDVINTLPGQTREQWQAELARAVSLGPDHISVYGLTVEDGTPFAADLDAGRLVLPDEDLAAGLYELTHDLLTAEGFEQYEIASFARQGRRSRHNTGYWRGHGYLGIGAGAHSLILDTPYGRRCANPADTDAYLKILTDGGDVAGEIIELSRSDAMAEFMFLGLRMTEGVTLAAFRDRFREDLLTRYSNEIAQLEGYGLIARSETGLSLTRRGRLLSNQVFQAFIP